MTPTDPLPEPIARFIDKNVESIEQLEILRILGETPAQEWSSADLAVAAQISPADMSAHLAALEQRGLLKIEPREPAPICRYGAATPERENQLTELLQFYREKPVTLIRAMYNRNNDRLKAFAASFRLRKEQ